MSDNQTIQDAININRDSCVRCATCVNACPVQALTMTEDGIVYDPVICVSCGMCSQNCPIGAIIFNDRSSRSQNKCIKYQTQKFHTKKQMQFLLDCATTVVHGAVFISRQLLSQICQNDAKADLMLSINSLKEKIGQIDSNKIDKTQKYSSGMPIKPPFAKYDTNYSFYGIALIDSLTCKPVGIGLVTNDRRCHPFACFGLQNKELKYDLSHSHGPGQGSDADFRSYLGFWNGENNAGFGLMRNQYFDCFSSSSYDGTSSIEITAFGMFEGRKIQGVGMIVYIADSSTIYDERPDSYSSSVILHIGLLKCDNGQFDRDISIKQGIMASVSNDRRTRYKFQQLSEVFAKELYIYNSNLKLSRYNEGKEVKK